MYVSEAIVPTHGMFRPVRKQAALPLADPKHPGQSSYLKLKPNVVDGDGVLPGIVLGDTCQKRLREVEPRDPKDHRGPTGDPILGPQKQNSVHTKPTTA